jgi:hypothetical protein
VHRLAIRLQYAAPRPFTAPWGFKSVFTGVRAGSAGRPAWLWPLSDSGTSGCLGGRQRFCTSEGIRPVRLPEINIGAVAYRAMWGYGVGPPSDTNDHALTCDYAMGQDLRRTYPQVRDVVFVSGSDYS